ncbi:UNVERIFIED_CONTAM: Pre-mRNA-splicing factor 18 [Gekko kuhli]
MEEKQLMAGSKKYFKRSELAKKEEEAYFERCGYKVQQKEEEEEKQMVSPNPVLELELAEEKLPMTLSRQETHRQTNKEGHRRIFQNSSQDTINIF